jgi:hypothetical protein
LLIIEIKNNFARGNCKKLLENYYNPTWSNFMKKQIIAKINNIANELDRNGLYAEANSLTNVMKKLALDQFRDNENFDEMFGEMDDDREPNLPDPPRNQSNVAVRKSDTGFYVTAFFSTDKSSIYLGEKTGRESAGGFKSPFKSKMDAIVYAQEWADELGRKYDILFSVVDRTSPNFFILSSDFQSQHL